MKELYISPELEILCFEPIEELANYIPEVYRDDRGSRINDGLSTGESVPGEVVDPVDPDPLD